MTRLEVQSAVIDTGMIVYLTVVSYCICSGTRSFGLRSPSADPTVVARPSPICNHDPMIHRPQPNWVFWFRSQFCLSFRRQSRHLSLSSQTMASFRGKIDNAMRPSSGAVPEELTNLGSTCRNGKGLRSCDFVKEDVQCTVRVLAWNSTLQFVRCTAHYDSWCKPANALIRPIDLRLPRVHKLVRWRLGLFNARHNSNFKLQKKVHNVSIDAQFSGACQMRKSFQVINQNQWDGWQSESFDQQ